VIIYESSHWNFVVSHLSLAERHKNQANGDEKSSVMDGES
jgi:hypothetical protein